MAADHEEVWVDAGEVSLRLLVWDGSKTRTVLFVHGSQGHVGVWFPVVPTFREAGFRVAALDQRGHGASSRSSTYRVEDYVEDLLTAMEHLGPAAVVGHSMGGLNAIIAAARRPELFLALVHVDIDPAPPDWQSQFLHEAGARLPRTYESADAAIAHLLPRLAPSAAPGRVAPAILAGLVQTGDGRLALNYDPATLRDFGPYEVRPLLPKLTMPVLVIRGTESQVMTDAGESDFRALLPEARIEVVLGGHHLFWDDPDAFSAPILDFLNEYRP